MLSIIFFHVSYSTNPVCILMIVVNFPRVPSCCSLLVATALWEEVMELWYLLGKLEAHSNFFSSVRDYILTAWAPSQLSFINKWPLVSGMLLSGCADLQRLYGVKDLSHAYWRNRLLFLFRTQPCGPVLLEWLPQLRTSTLWKWLMLPSMRWLLMCNTALVMLVKSLTWCVILHRWIRSSLSPT